MFVGGGNTFRLLSEIRRAGFVGAARQFNQSGGDYYGGSAGAVVACDTVAIALGHDDNGPGLRDMTALGLIPGVAILPHFDGSQVAVAAEWAAEHHATVLGVPESIGLRCLDGRILVLGAGRLTRLTPSAIDEFAPGDTVTVD